jgi:hypothetical protein
MVRGSPASGRPKGQAGRYSDCLILATGYGDQGVAGDGALERNQSKRGLPQILEGGFFFRKMALSRIAFGLRLLWFRYSGNNSFDETQLFVKKLQNYH